MDKLRIGLYGYGNVARGIEASVESFSDLEVAAVFTRRDPLTVDCRAPVYSTDALAEFVGRLDVVIMCGGSLKDIPQFAPEVLRQFSVVDSFDTHAKIADYLGKMDKIGRESGRLAMVSCGWDPGLFSLARLMFSAFLPCRQPQTFFGPGISQGHSEAIRRVEGVADARQYTVPSAEALEAARRGESDFPYLQRHERVCYVVAKEGANREEIRRQIVTMPDYFAGQKTVVNFVDAQTLARDHGAMPHGGVVMHSGEIGGIGSSLELKIALERNPNFTACVLLAAARAVGRMSSEGRAGAITMMDVPLHYFHSLSREELVRTLL